MSKVKTNLPESIRKKIVKILKEAEAAKGSALTADEMKKIVAGEIKNAISGMNLESEVEMLDMGVLDEYEKVTGLPLPKQNASDIVEMLSKLDTTGASYAMMCCIFNKFSSMKEGVDMSPSDVEFYFDGLISSVVSHKYSIFGHDFTVEKESFGQLPEVLKSCQHGLDILELAVEVAKDRGLNQADAKKYIETVMRTSIARSDDGLMDKISQAGNLLTMTLATSYLDEAGLSKCEGDVSSALKKSGIGKTDSERAKKLLKQLMSAMNDLSQQDKRFPIAAKTGLEFSELAFGYNIGLVDKADYMTIVSELNNVILGK
jgi:hypothetical protein